MDHFPATHVNGRVSGLLPVQAEVLLEDGRRILCRLERELPLAVGDLVSVELIEGEQPRVSATQPRRSVITRLKGDRTRREVGGLHRQVLAANVDLGVIVASVKRPPFHARFVDRYLLLCEMGGVEPLICLSKCDLTDERPPELEVFLGLGIPVIETSTDTGLGLEELRSALHGRTAVLLGASGVGKSSLSNALVPGLTSATREVSAHSGKGRHTTTRSNLYRWAPDSYLIDTPGIRAIGLEDLSPSDILDCLPDFEEYARSCKFRDCQHLHEPGCGVRAAAESGAIHPYRYDSYARMARP